MDTIPLTALHNISGTALFLPFEVFLQQVHQVQIEILGLRGLLEAAHGGVKRIAQFSVGEFGFDGVPPRTGLCGGLSHFLQIGLRCRFEHVELEADVNEQAHFIGHLDARAMEVVDEHSEKLYRVERDGVVCFVRRRFVQRGEQGVKLLQRNGRQPLADGGRIAIRGDEHFRDAGVVFIEGKFDNPFKRRGRVELCFVRFGSVASRGAECGK